MCQASPTGFLLPDPTRRWPLWLTNLCLQQIDLPTDPPTNRPGEMNKTGPILNYVSSSEMLNIFLALIFSKILYFLPHGNFHKINAFKGKTLTAKLP